MIAISLIPSNSKAAWVEYDGWDGRPPLPGCITPPVVRSIDSKIGPIGNTSSLEIQIPPLLWVLDNPDQYVYVYYPTPSGWYPFQFDNIYYDGHICWGNNAPPRSLRRAYSLFWMSPFLDEAGIKNQWNGATPGYHKCNRWVNSVRCPPVHRCPNFLLPDCQCRCCENRCFCSTDCQCCQGACRCHLLRGNNPDWVAFRKALLQDYVQTVTKLRIPQTRSKVRILEISDTARGFSQTRFAHPIEEIDGDWALEPTTEDKTTRIVPRAEVFLV